MNKIPFRIVLLLFLCTAAWAQDNPLSISADADSLLAQLRRAPADRVLQRKLIDEYLRVLSPELALVEISYAEANGTLGDVALELKGLVEASLEHIRPALRDLKQAYLRSPSDELLLTISLLEYADGNRALGKRLLSRLYRRSPSIAVDLLNRYEQYHTRGRRTLARAAAAAMHDADSASFETFFPSPRISLLSPAEGFTTEGSSVSIIFDVQHSRPVRRVFVKNDVVFEANTTTVLGPKENTNRNFSHLTSLAEGRNVIPIRVEDVFGVESVRPVVVDRLSFSADARWRSPAADTLRAAMALLKNYSGERVLLAQKNPAYRAVVIAGGPTSDSTEWKSRALGVHAFLTHPFIGSTREAQTKILVGDRLTASNIDLVFREWLLKSTTLQSVTIIYICASWNITPERWEIRDARGGIIDLKSLLSQISSVASSGIVLVCDGRINDRRALETGLQSWASTSSMSTLTVIAPSENTWPARLNALVASPDSLRSRSRSLTVQDVGAALRVPVIGGSRSSIVLGQNPAVVVVEDHRSLFSRLEKALSSSNISREAQTTILNFCQDWRRTGEIRRFLDNQLTLSDLMVRADEYRTRNR